MEATDPNGDTLNYSLTTFPAGMTINNNSGLIQWIPGSGQTGENSVVVKVYDGTFSVQQSFSIMVSVVNTAPEIISFPGTIVLEDSVYLYDVNADDIDSLTFSLNIYASGMGIDDGSGLLEWMPSNTHVGMNLVDVVVSDGSLTDNQSFYINVTPVNDVPVFSSSGVSNAYLDATYTYEAVAYDPDNQNNVGYDDDTLSYSLSTYPIGMTITENIISWIATDSQLGTVEVVVVVTDGEETTTQSFTITVSESQSEAFADASSGGGGGGGGSSSSVITPPIGMFLFEETEESTVYAIKQPGVAVTEFLLSAKGEFKGGLDNINIKVFRLTEKPSDVSSPFADASTGSGGSAEKREDGKVYQYLKIEKSDVPDELIENTIIKFKVEKSWMRQNNEGKEDVVLIRYHAEKWQDLPTYIDYEDDEFVYYKAITPGFSIFAVIFKVFKEKFKIDPNAEIYSISVDMPKHVYGVFYTSDGNIMVPSGLKYVFTNTRTEEVYEGETGEFGNWRNSGVYTVLLQGERGDIITVMVNDKWETSFEMKGDKEINFNTSIRPNMLQWIVSKLLYIIIIIVVLGCIIFCVIKKKSWISWVRNEAYINRITKQNMGLRKLKMKIAALGDSIGMNSATRVKIGAGMREFSVDMHDVAGVSSEVESEGNYDKNEEENKQEDNKIDDKQKDDGEISDGIENNSGGEEKQMDVMKENNEQSGTQELKKQMENGENE